MRIGSTSISTPSIPFPAPASPHKAPPTREGPLLCLGYPTLDDLVSVDLRGVYGRMGAELHIHSVDHVTYVRIDWVYMNMNSIPYRKYAYELRTGDCVDELGFVLSSITIGFTTLLSILLDDCSFHVYDYPGDTLFDCAD